jgi:hypothetical protein
MTTPRRSTHPAVGLLEFLFHKPDLSRDDVLANSQFRAFCACGTAAGAEYYARQHNRTLKENHPLVIEFTSSIDDIYVDSRDFLCTAFQFWDRESSAYRAWQSAVLSRLFGPGILRYFDACQSTDQTRRIAMCNLAAFDPDVASLVRARMHVPPAYQLSFLTLIVVNFSAVAGSLRESNLEGAIGEMIQELQSGVIQPLVPAWCPRPSGTRGNEQHIPRFTRCIRGVGIGTVQHQAVVDGHVPELQSCRHGFTQERTLAGEEQIVELTAKLASGSAEWPEQVRAR